MGRKNFSFFTPEMGARLKSLRERAGLTEAELARRMGIGYRTGKAFVARLEAGKIADPHLSTITFYVEACGGQLNEVIDSLSRSQPAPVDLAPVENALLRPEGKQYVMARVQDNVHDYQRGIERPAAGGPMPRKRRGRAIAAYQEWITQMRIAQQQVRDYLNTTDTSVHWYRDYYSLSQRFLGAYRRFGAPGKKAKLEQRLFEVRDYARREKMPEGRVESVRAIAEDVILNWQARRPTADD